MCQVRVFVRERLSCKNKSGFARLSDQPTGFVSVHFFARTTLTFPLMVFHLPSFLSLPFSLSVHIPSPWFPPSPRSTLHLLLRHENNLSEIFNLIVRLLRTVLISIFSSFFPLQLCWI